MPGGARPPGRPDGAGEDTIVSGAVAASAVQIGVYVLGFVASVLIARGLGPAGRGEYYLPVTAGLTAMAVLHLSIESSNTFFFAERRFSLTQLSRSAGTFVLVVSPIGIGLLFLFYALADDSVFEGVDTLDFAIAAAVLPLQLHLLWMGGILQLAKRLSRAQKALFMGAVVQLIVIATLYLLDELTVTVVLLAYAASIAVPWALQVRIAHGLVGVRPLVDRAVIRPVIRFALKLHVGLVFSFLLLRADVFLVGYYLDAAAVGVYSLAVIFAELGLMLTMPLVMAALPYQAEAAIRPAGELSFRVARVNGLIALAVGAAFAATLWLGIPVLYGTNFEDAYAALVVLLPGIVAMALLRPLGNWLVRQERPGTMAGLAFGAFALNCALNVLLIPELGIIGASLASSVAYAAFAVAYLGWGLRAAGLTLREGLFPRREELAQLRELALGPLRR